MNPDKTKIMPVHKKNRQQIDNLQDIIINGRRVEWTEEYKYLGYMLDSSGGH